MKRFYNQIRDNKVYLVYTPLILYWILLAIATSIPTQNFPKFLTASDKVEHLLAYFGLALLFSLTLHFQQKNKFLSKNFYFAAIIIISSYGLIDEFHQYFIPGRFFDMLDWLANFTGTLIGSSVTYFFIKKNGHDYSSA